MNYESLNNEELRVKVAEKKPVIFLDIDGVLNGHRSFASGYCGIEREQAENLNAILCAVPDANLVISSAWRYMVPDAMTLKGFEYLLLVSGVHCKDRVVGITPKDEEVATRGGQILNWVSRNTDSISRFAILDDMAMDFKEWGLGSNFFQTDGAKGITRETANAIIEFLNPASDASRSSR
jgi:hypothetical protein